MVAGCWLRSRSFEHRPNKSLNPNELDAVLVGPSSDQTASWALAAKQSEAMQPGSYVYNAIAEARAVMPQSYTSQSPAPSPFYLARGTRQLYARSGWDSGATWGGACVAPNEQ